MTDTLYSEILPRLWIGGTDDWDVIDIPKSLPRLDAPQQFDAVATLYAYAHPMGWGVHEQRYGFPDAELEPHTVQRIEEMAHWIFDRWTRGDVVLARCQAGLNRSALVLALALLRAGLDPNRVIHLLREKRSPEALSNPHFEAYVLKQRPHRGVA